MEAPQQLLSRQRRPRIVTRWHPNQMAVTHHTPLDIIEGKERILESLDFATLDRVLQEKTGFHLEPFTWQDIARPTQNEPEPQKPQEPQEPDQPIRTSADIIEPTPLESPLGKYLFPHPSGKGTLAISFFHLKGSDETFDGTTDVVHLINKDPDAFVSSPDVQLLACMPNWFNGGTSGDPFFISHGCPATPPFPVSDARADLNWHIELPVELPEKLKDATGKGVHVFVLDTVPPADQIFQAVNSGTNNRLLTDMYNQVDFHYYLLADVLDQPNPAQPATGSDIYGRLAGFRMNDHGVFIAGIIHDIAPDAKVECIRVLNDYAIGDTVMLTSALNYIQNRLLPFNPDTQAPGDLYQTHARVVVNLSLTIPPAEETLASLGYSDRTAALARLGLLLPMQALASYGVVFVASSGNASGPHDHMTRLPEKRLLPDYPAAYAYPLLGLDEVQDLPAMIPVGAINQTGGAASYSNYPGPKGIGAYGGELPQPLPPMPDPRTSTQVQYPVDALRGVYTNPYYSALSEDDPSTSYSPAPILYPEYPRPAANTWAYWSGTSFATPIISALAARVLEHQSPSDDSVRRTLLEAARGVVDWTNLDTEEEHAYGPMIMVQQNAIEL
jgi:subtilisin family serine protease